MGLERGIYRDKREGRGGEGRDLCMGCVGLGFERGLGNEEVEEWGGGRGRGRGENESEDWGTTS